MSKKDMVPLISETAFSCPRCGAYTTQKWYRLLGDSYSEQLRTPTMPNSKRVEKFRKEKDIPEKARNKFLQWEKKMLSGKPFFEHEDKTIYNPTVVNNCNITKCYNCKEISVWVYDQIVYPRTKIDIQPNGDLPEHIRCLFEEAREIVNSSPKGAAALLRLCVQYLCMELGESGKNIDRDIAELVGKGLSPKVQMALDVVRVIGNESVHPGKFDLKDSKEMAIKLFELVNLIAEQMISHPKQVADLYGSLPASKLEGIERRDKKRHIAEAPNQANPADDKKRHR